MKLINKVMKFIEKLEKWLDKNNPLGEKLYDTSKLLLGQDLSHKVSNNLGCAESVSRVLKIAFNDDFFSVSTYNFYQMLRGDKKWRQVYFPVRGDAIISPTGYGNGHGHIGIISDNNIIHSNNSYTGKWSAFYTIPKWKDYYGREKKFPVFYFRRVK